MTLLQILNYSTPLQNGCITYRGCQTDSGHCQVWIENKHVYVHRQVWELNKGTIPEGFFVLHNCDTPNCVNINHLFLGTRADNNKDRHIKGRTVVPDNTGSWHGMAKLNEEVVKEILVLCQLLPKKAVYFYVQFKLKVETSLPDIYAVATKRTWTHVKMPSIQEAALIYQKYKEVS